MDYRFAIRCWQDQAGDENAKANVFVDGVQVATEVEITATSEDAPQLITWESTGLIAPAADTTFDIKVELVNEYYVDSDTDRNIRINDIGYIPKHTDGNYWKTIDGVWTQVTDFNTLPNNYWNIIPTAVTGDQTPDDWWTGRDTDSFYTIVIWGGSGDITDSVGVTITIPVTGGAT